MEVSAGLVGVADVRYALKCLVEVSIGPTVRPPLVDIFYTWPLAVDLPSSLLERKGTVQIKHTDEISPKRLVNVAPKLPCFRAQKSISRCLAVGVSGYPRTRDSFEVA
ncbi:hypothetical protein KM043_005728 [Ampulex compressa]|nr:hypothetical protein KM043_005728 [Ampulex compressa]